MSEKRYWLMEGYVRDNGLVGEKSISFQEAVDRLNELSDENEQLKSTNMEYEDALGRLEEENEQLKQEKDGLFLFFMDYYDQLEDELIEIEIKLEERIKELEKENEQLKQEIRVIEKAKDSFYDKVEGLLTEHIEYNQLKPENMDSVIKELNGLKMEIFE